MRDRRGHRVRTNAERFFADARAQYRKKEEQSQETAMRDLRIQRANENTKVIRFGLGRSFTHRRGATASSAQAFVNGPHRSANFHHRFFNLTGQQLLQES